MYGVPLEEKVVMVHNVGKIDRIIRMSLALVLVALYYMYIADGNYNTYFLFGTVMLFITSMRKCCPIYATLGFGFEETIFYSFCQSGTKPS